MFSFPCYSQENLNKGTFLFASAKYHTGRHLYSGQKLKDELKNGYSAVELRFGWQTWGKHEWEKEHNYPSIGIGFYTGFIGDVDIFGRPHAAFGFATFPIGNSRGTNFQIEPALGLAFNLKPYNELTNVINDAIGAKYGAYIALHLGANTKLSKAIDLQYGFDITHISNGRVVTPNKGLNMVGLSVGFRYNFNGAQHNVDKSVHPTLQLPARPVTGPKQKARSISESNISIYQAFGTVQNKVDAGTDHRYLISSSIIEYQYKFNTKHGFSVGADLFVDPSACDTTEYIVNKETMERAFPAAHIGYDFMFWKLSLKLQIGVHLWHTGRELKGNTFVRPAIRYEINRRLFAQAGLKTMNGAKADWVELGIGFKIYYRCRHLGK